MNDDENFLAHHGILGQKWGVRRYQNADGSLTALGKRRRKSNSSNSGKGVGFRRKNKNSKQVARSPEELKKFLREHPKQVYKHRDLLSPDDMQEVIKKIEFDRKCADISREEYTRGLRKIKDIDDSIKTVSSFMNTSVTAYNNAALIYNAFSDPDGTSGGSLRKIEWNTWNKNEKKNKDDDNNN